MLGTATSLIVGGANAADLPIKAEAIVKVCSLYGAGFYYIPGTDTCIKLGGNLRADVLANTSSYAGNTNDASGAQNRFTNGYTWRSRLDSNIDMCMATEYGLDRIYKEVVFTWTTDSVLGDEFWRLTDQLIDLRSYGTIISGGCQAPAMGQLGRPYFAVFRFAGFTMGRLAVQRALDGLRAGN